MALSEVELGHVPEGRRFFALQSARKCDHIGSVVKEGNLSPWQAMCLHLLFERACGEASFWHPYIALLPTELELLGIHPMLWSQVRISLPYYLLILMKSVWCSS